MIETIELALKKFPKAKRIAVENFVSTASTALIDWTDNVENLKMDARLYNWNNDTVYAIKWAMAELGKQ